MVGSELLKCQCHHSRHKLEGISENKKIYVIEKLNTIWGTDYTNGFMMDSIFTIYNFDKKFLLYKAYKSLKYGCKIYAQSHETQKVKIFN